MIWAKDKKYEFIPIVLVVVDLIGFIMQFVYSEAMPEVRMAYVLQFFLSLACVTYLYTRDSMEQQNKAAKAIKIEDERSKLVS